jgi:hypothetical protein
VGVSKKKEGAGNRARQVYNQTTSPDGAISRIPYLAQTSADLMSKNRTIPSDCCRCKAVPRKHLLSVGEKVIIHNTNPTIELMKYADIAKKIRELPKFFQIGFLLNVWLIALAWIFQRSSSSLLEILFLPQVKSVQLTEHVMQSTEILFNPIGFVLQAFFLAIFQMPYFLLAWLKYGARPLHFATERTAKEALFFGLGAAIFLLFETLLMAMLFWFFPPSFSM